MAEGAILLFKCEVVLLDFVQGGLDCFDRFELVLGGEGRQAISFFAEFVQLLLLGLGLLLQVGQLFRGFGQGFGLVPVVEFERGELSGNLNEFGAECVLGRRRHHRRCLTHELQLLLLLLRGRRVGGFCGGGHLAPQLPDQAIFVFERLFFRQTLTLDLLDHLCGLLTNHGQLLLQLSVLLL